MKAVRETTVWETEFQPNHTYLIDGDKIFAYIKVGKKKPIYFTAPLQMNLKGRKFIDLKKNPFDKPTPVVSSTIVKVAGSKGEMYDVDPVAGTCTCMGFTYRGTCKHIGTASSK